MLKYNNDNDRYEMMKYYRTSDMINLMYYFPNLSPITDIVIVEDEQDYLNNKEYLENFNQNRVDTLKGQKFLTGIENSGKNNCFYETLLKVKEKDSGGVLVLFNISTNPTERYERYAGISVGVNLGENIMIDAVSKGFDGREVSKSICTHERYYIPWFDLRKINISNFKEYRTYIISDEEYKNTREERINFLESIGLNKNDFVNYIPIKYQEIPDFIWESVIRKILKVLEKNEDFLSSNGFTNFAISGHTEGKEFSPWQMFDKSRYTELINNNENNT